MLAEKIRPLLEKYLSRARPLLVGVSGGADSLCLLDIFMKLDYPVMVAHFNHGLRPEASDDARTVELIAACCGVPFILGEGATPDYAREYSLSIEEAARELRYRFLFEHAEKQNAQAVAIAHNADDQVETVLMHLLRGSGLDGLTGMPFCSLPNPWSEEIPLIRPLLDTWRSEIEACCKEHHLKPILDKTNTDTTYFRNRLRHELIPELETYIPGFRSRLHQTADLLAADRDVLGDLAEKTWGDTIQQAGSGYVAFQLGSFQHQPVAMQRRLIRKAVAHLRPGSRDLNFAMVQSVVDFSAEPTFTKQKNIGLGLGVFLEDEKLIIATGEADLPPFQRPQIKDDMVLHIPGKLDLENGWILRAEIVDDLPSIQEAAVTNDDPSKAWIDLEKSHSTLHIRPRRPGDRFRPLGMDGKSMKISDFMINEKIPQRVRAAWPLVCVGDEIVWVPGYRLSETFRVTSKTSQGVLLVLARK